MFGQKPKVKPVPSTPFSEFIRNAKSGEKKRVYTDVMRKASEEQNRVLNSSEAAK